MTLTPYIIFGGNCEEAINFYADVLGGEVRDISRYGGSPAQGESADKNKVLHAHVFVNGNLFMMASDAGDNQPVETTSGMVHLSLNFTDSGKIQNVFSRMSDGGTVVMDLQDTFWGATFGMLIDQYGVKWMFNHDKKK